MNAEAVMPATQGHDESAWLPEDGGRAAIARLLPADTVRELSKIDPVRAAAQVFLEYAMIGAAIVLSERFWHPALYALTVAFLGARYLALGVLMHDAAHYRMFRNRAVNDWVGSYLLGPAMLLSMSDYRKNHMTHHRCVATADDPEREFRMMFTSRGKTIMLIVGSFIGISGLMLILGINRGKSLLIIAAGAVGFAALLWLHPAAGRLVGLYWLVPFFTWTASANVLRTFAEHVTLPEGEAKTTESRIYAARSVVLPFLTRLFLAPNNVGYHLDHHIYPSVPFYRLPKLHRLLAEQSSFREHEREFFNFREVIGDHVARSGKPA